MSASWVGEPWLDFEALSEGRTYRRLLTRVVLVRDPRVTSLPRLRSSGDVYRHFKDLCRLDRECFAALLLDRKHRVVGINVVSVGCLEGTAVHPREVFKPAILANAAAIIVIHNHPSGDPAPSREDREVSERLRAAGDLLGIHMLDHVIVAAEGHWSLADERVSPIQGESHHGTH